MLRPALSSLLNRWGLRRPAPVTPHPGPLASAARLLTTGCAAASLSAVAAEHWPMHWSGTVAWLLGLASHWQWLYLAVGGLAGLLWLVLGRKRALLALAVLVFAWSRYSPAAPEAAPAAAGEAAVLRVGSANLYVGTTDFTALQAWLLGPAAPDVVFLQEYTPAAEAAVSTPGVLARYPHRLLAAAEDPFGLALLSRFPLVQAAPLLPKDRRHTRRLRAVLDWQGRPVAVSAVHPMPPFNAEFMAARDAAFREEAGWLQATSSLAVLAGDLNDTPWSTGMRGVAPGLRRATGLAPTWPSLGGWLSVLPLDHVLVSPAWRRGAPQGGASLGSDHRAVVVDLMPSL
ncbi:endonuclease/exonuclease/phosphatase family protein [Eleftheria terrae]|uniref:endonuclease/exonuclease/phosphatase family protein n=1 Tax=Eleftheria terrae TaxID=1597781 RepID=UPI00263A4C9D|nr:endonuclease/exonuclease/phosphatase family protein [Eleftheria terrae]WKB53557.1 endonuclease/exonuclease/phosphatase family protein [Eleftheria terrae]